MFIVNIIFFNLLCVSNNLCRYLRFIHAESKICVFGAHAAEWDTQEMCCGVTSFILICLNIVWFYFVSLHVKNNSLCYADSNIKL